jgi:hypothetical protein
MPPISADVGEAVGQWAVSEGRECDAEHREGERELRSAGCHPDPVWIAAAPAGSLERDRSDRGQRRKTSVPTGKAASSRAGSGVTARGAAISQLPPDGLARPERALRTGAPPTAPLTG